MPPAETIPRATASSSAGPEPRVSRPTKTATAARPGGGGAAEALDELERQGLPHDAAHAVGSEELRAMGSFRRYATECGRPLRRHGA